MQNEAFCLPSFPAGCDLWRALKDEKRPILIYGMGNGADKLIARFQELNIEFRDIFASDGFVRGHSFHGIRVKSFSEVKELYHDFVIVLSFASNREEVLSLLSEIDGKYDLIIPDMPVAGSEYFDSNFCNTHYEEIRKAYSSLYDEKSKEIFASIINYKLTGKFKFLENAYVSREELYALINCGREIKGYLDGGAYNGDTLREAISFFPSLSHAVLVEPDKRSFKKLSAFAENIDKPALSLYNAALWSDAGHAEFISSGNRNSSINSTASYENKTTEIEKITVDSVAKSKMDFIKYDVEGAELEALLGSHETIMRDKPVLLVSAYHRSEDVFSLINYLNEKYPFYKLYLRRLRCVPAWELDIIAIPE